MHTLAAAFLAVMFLAAGAPPASAQLSAPLPLPGDLGAALPAGAQREAAVARGGDAYLVVWTDTRVDLAGTVGGPSPPSASDLYAMRFDAAGRALDRTPIVVASEPQRQFEPDVAWNGSAWLATYVSERQLSVTDQGIYARRISAAGAVLDPTPILIDDTDFVSERWPCVASDGVDWVVGWHDENFVNGNRQTKFRRVTPTGQPLNVVTKFNVATNSFPRRGRLAFSGGEYLFVAELDTQVIALPMAPSLANAGFQMSLTGDGEHPVVAADGTGFYVAWSRDELFDTFHGTTVSTTNQIGSPGGDLLATLSTQTLDPRPALAWDGTQYWLAIDDQATGGEAVEGYRIDTSGTPVGGAVVLSNTAQVAGSVLAGGAVAGELFAVWEADLAGFPHLHGATAAGPAVAQHGPLEAATPNQLESDLAGNEQDGYLVVQVSRRGGESRVLATRLDGQGNVLDLVPIVVHVGTEGVHGPRVAWNGAHWLVCWETWPSPVGAQFGSTVSCRRVAHDGTLADPAATTLMTGVNWPDVGALGGEFLVAASRITSLDIRKVWCERVDANGVPSGVEVLVGDDHGSYPKVEAVGANWVVAWQHKLNHDSSGSTAVFRFVDATGQPQGTQTTVGGGAEWLDLAARQGTTFAVAYSNQDDVLLKRYTALGAEVPLGTFGVASGPRDQFKPVLGSDGGSYQVAWIDYRIHPSSDRQGLGDVWLEEFGTSGAPLSDEAPVAIDPVRPETVGGVAGDGGRTLVTYHALVDDGVSLGWRTFLRVREPSVVCQDDLGFGGPGYARLSLCGSGLGWGQSSNLLLEGAPASAATALVVGVTNAPVPLFGGLLVPSDLAVVLWSSTDAAGRLGPIPVAGGHPASPVLYAQMVSVEPGSVTPIVFSNAVRGQYLP